MSIPLDPAQAGLDHRRQLRQAATDRILALAPHLADHDRALIEQVYQHGQSPRAVARATGVPASRLNRRLSRILGRIRQPLFQFVASRSELLPREVAATARLVVLEGESLRATAQRTGQSLHRVRRHMETVRAYHRLVGLQNPRG
jgi:DNA-directed RNA polymerase specialized sigma24 family protein